VLYIASGVKAKRHKRNEAQQIALQREQETLLLME
jgi:hypothetical protein